MNLRDFAKLLRSRWITVAATALIVIFGAVAYTWLTTPLYQASTRLFVSTSSGASVSDLYQGNLFSQQRVLSYAQLLNGETLAQRTIDKLGLDMSASSLEGNISAEVLAGTVLIDVRVLDTSPVRARDIANALSDEFVVMVRELETPVSGAAPDARVVVEQRASIPTDPVIPQPLRNLALGTALGALLGVGIAVVRDQLDNTIKNRQTLEDAAGTAVVGVVPLDKDLRISAISFSTDNSGTSEAFRKIRTNLQFLSVDDPPRLIVITSSLSSEGKSTTAINIALALAEADHNVVLVDGDLRRPKLAKYLGALGTVGFSTALSGAAPLNEILQKTKFPGLTVLAAGPIPPNPSELLGSLAAKKVLTDLRRKFDYVIVDSAPLLAVTDSAILAANADGALIVARSGSTKREQLQHAVGALHDVGASLLGAVLNMVLVRGSGSDSYSYYHYESVEPTAKRASDASNTRNAKAPSSAESTRVEAEPEDR